MSPLVVTLMVALGAMGALWLVSLAKRDASIVDAFWGPGIALLAATAAALGDGYPGRVRLVLALVTLWGLRLGLYLLWRSWGEDEDYRYREMRARWGPPFPWVSLATVFGLQGLAMWAVSLPVQVAVRAPAPAALTWLDALGTVLWTIGFAFEAIGDLQLARFRADPASRGQVMDRGLWRYTRHPNYFGDALLWWGFWVIALATPRGAWTIVSPLVMTWVLLRLSGVALLERKLVKTRPKYADYVARTSAFIPWPPKRAPGAAS